MHTDYDLQLTSHPAALWCLGQNAPHGVATFHFPCLTDRWTLASPVPHPCPTLAPPLPHRCLTRAPHPCLTRASPNLPPHCFTPLPYPTALPHCSTRRAWTKAEVASTLRSSAAMLDTATLYAGLLALRRTPEAEAFLQEWLELTMRGARLPSHARPCYLVITPSCRSGSSSR